MGDNLLVRQDVGIALQPGQVDHLLLLHPCLYPLCISDERGK